jgi:hypothetical protein
MLKVITSITDPLIDLIKDDPVRPAIPTQARVHDHAEILVLIEDGVPAAVVTTQGFGCIFNQHKVKIVGYC